MKSNLISRLCKKESSESESGTKLQDPIVPDDDKHVYVFIHFSRGEMDYLVKASNREEAATFLCDRMNQHGGHWEWTMITARAIEHTVKFYNREQVDAIHYFRIVEMPKKFRVMEII